MALMTERGFQEEGEAAGKWRRALLTSTQLSTYFVGYTEVAAIARGPPGRASPRGPGTTAMLGHGSPVAAPPARPPARLTERWPAVGRSAPHRVRRRGTLRTPRSRVRRSARGLERGLARGR